MNSIQLIGRLTHDPESRGGSGKEVCRLRVAVSRQGRDAEPIYVDVISFDALAKTCLEYLETGRQIAVEGRLEQSVWKTDDGSRRERHEVIARSIGFLARARARKEEPSENGSAPAQAAA